MKRWGVVWIVAVLSCIPILLIRGTSQAMLADTDTAFLLKVIRERQAPLSWFTGDWPLFNHFYRPISTLTFEMDNALYGDNAAGFGWTNALLCTICVLLVAWLWRELTDSIPLTAFSTLLFGLWHWGGTGMALPLLGLGVWVIGFFGLFRHGLKVWYWLPAVGAVGFLTLEVAGLMPLQHRMIAWIPGRTASTMTVFCLVAMAAYARYERLSAKRDEPRPTAMDEPAGTRSSVILDSRPKRSWIWGVLSVLATALAFGSYEQAVMLPAALLGVAVSLRLQRYRVRWGWQIAFWSLLIVYIIARKTLLPEGTSDYQAQQFRNGPGVFLALTGYFLPCLGSLFSLYKSLDIGAAILMTGQVYGTLWEAYTNVSAFLAAKRHWALALTGYALSILTFLPMAWLNPFDHYHYWPMAMRSLFVTVLAWGTWELCVNAVSPPARQAPPRPSPAPGSLPHP